MSLDPDFQREISDRAEPPAFDAVLTRARRGRQRRRTAIGAGLATAVVLVGAGIGGGMATGGHDAAPPATTSPTPTGGNVSTGTVHPELPPDVKSVLSRPMTDVWTISGAADGSTAAIYQGCEQPTDAGEQACDRVLVIRHGDSVIGRVLKDAPPYLHPTGDGWLLSEDGDWSLVDTDGRSRPPTFVDQRLARAYAGDVAVLADSWRLLRDDQLITLPKPPGNAADAAYVTASGRVIAVEERARSVWWSDDGARWHGTFENRTETVSAVMLAGNGDTVAMALLGDSPDGSIPLLEVAVSSDAGETWERASGSQLPFGGEGPYDVSSMVVSPQGTTYLATGSHGLIRVDERANVTAVRTSERDTSVFRRGDAVCVLTERGRVDDMACSDDDGRTWLSQSLPGYVTVIATP